MEIAGLPAFSDNYIWTFHDPSSRKTAVVDPGESKVVLDYLEKNQRQLDIIFLTHHHWDHVSGVEELKNKTGCRVIGSTYDRHRLPFVDHFLSEGDEYQWESFSMKVLFIPGHTLGHIAYWIPDPAWLFCGDTLFSMGCGRLFEGTPAQMLESLQKIKSLPDSTQVFCGHEYTESNGRFALTIEPDNQAIHDRMKEVRNLRAQSLPTLPVSIEIEKATNPFLRSHLDNIRSSLKMTHASELEVWTELRTRKNNF